jgi:hypothetical protein
MAISQVDVLLMVTSALEYLNVSYVIGGSFASSRHGHARATMDIDLLAGIKQEHVTPLIGMLEPEFYIEESSVARAIRLRRHFNVVHMETAFKVDIFIAKEGGFDAKQLERGKLEIVSEDKRKACVTSAEDIVLAKLVWYRRGNEVSDQQWRDVINVLKVQAGQLDLHYMKQWAHELNVADLLEEAFKDSEV